MFNWASQCMIIYVPCTGDNANCVTRDHRRFLSESWWNASIAETFSHRGSFPRSLTSGLVRWQVDSVNAAQLHVCSWGWLWRRAMFVCDIYYINSSPCILVFFGGVVFFFWEAANITTLCAVISTNGMLCHIPTSGPNIIERQITILFSLLHKINSPESAYCGGLAWLLMLSFGFRHSRLVNEWFAAQPCLTKLFLPCTLPVLHSDRGNILSIEMEEVWSPAEQRDVGNSLYHFKIQTHNSPI